MGKKQEVYEEVVTMEGNKTTKKGTRVVYDYESLGSWPTKRDAVGILFGVAACVAVSLLTTSLH